MSSPQIHLAVILPAAGLSRRFVQGADGGGRSKLETELGGRAILQRAIELFTGRAEVRQVLVAANPDQLDTFKFKWADKLGFLGAQIVTGGRAERWETVANALQAVNDNVTHVAVHDAARPVTDKATIDQVLAAARHHDAVVPAVPIHETVKRVGSEPTTTGEADATDAILGAAGKPTVDAYPIIETVPRAGLWAAQTPQVFRRELLERAYRQTADGSIDTAEITDDAGLVESLGETVVAVSGDSLNVKVTVPEDVPFAEAVLALRSGQPASGSDPIGPKRRFPTWAESDED